MMSQILIGINNFIKNRLIELSGFLLILISIFLLASIVSYSPSDPNFIYAPENTEIKNIGGFYGSVVSDFLLQSLGLISIFLVFNFFNWGIKLATQKAMDNFITKIFFRLLSLFNSNISENFSFLISVYNFIIEQGHASFFNDLEIFSLLRKLKLFSDIAIVLLDLVFLLISLVIKSIAQLSFERLIAVTNPVRLPPMIHIFCFFMILFFIN